MNTSHHFLPSALPTLAAGMAIFLSSCAEYGKLPTVEKPLVDQKLRLNATHPAVRVQIVARKVKHTSGGHPRVTGTFDLVVQSGKVTHRMDLGTLIGSGHDNRLSFRDEQTTLNLQDLNHDGTKDTNILHGTDGYALISFDATARPNRLKFSGEPTGGYAKPQGTGPASELSTREFEIQDNGFRWRAEGGGKIDASWNKEKQVFELDI